MSAILPQRHYVRFDDDGTAAVRKRWSLLIEEFNQKYPLADGWRVETHVTFTTCLVPSLDGGALGPATMIRQELVTAEGVVVRNASSMDHITQPKAFERLETNAFIRLIERCGLSGNITDDDEASQLIAMGYAAASAKATPATTSSAPTATASPESPTRAVSAPANESTPVAGGTSVTAAASSNVHPIGADRKQEGRGRGSDPAGPPNATQRNMLGTLAARLQREVRVPATYAEAKALIATLNQELQQPPATTTA